MTFRSLTVLCLTLLFVLPSAGQGIAQSKLAVPNLTGRVVDNANMLSATARASATAMLKTHEAKSGNQIAVLTLPSLQGESLENYSITVARKWALGQKDKNNGVLFLVAKADRKMRIEVGYGLEGTLTDALASMVIRNTITPQFRKGKFELGILQGVARIVKILEADEATLKAYKEEARPSSYAKDEDSMLGLYFLIFIWLFIFFGSWIMGWLTRKFGREVKPGHWRWLWHDAGPNAPKPKRSSSSSSGGFSGSSGGFSGGGGSFGGGGSSGSW